MMRSIGLALLASAAVACGSASTTKTATTPAAPPSPAPALSAAPVAAAAAAPVALRRSDVRSVVQMGLGSFLRHVELDDQPVRKDGRFYGFRVASFPDPGFWSGVDLKPGDVVTRVNGMPIEHPEEALEAFRATEVASELRVAYEREGKARELRYPIVEDEPQKRADASAP